MDLFLFAMQYTVSVILEVLSIALFARAIFSWFDPMHEGGVSRFLLLMTEPVIFPIRMLCERMHWFENVPIDMPFLFTMILLSLLQIFLVI